MGFALLEEDAPAASAPGGGAPARDLFTQCRPRLPRGQDLISRSVRLGKSRRVRCGSMRRSESLSPTPQTVPVVPRSSYWTLQTLLQPCHAEEQQEQECQEATYERDDGGGVIH